MSSPYLYLDNDHLIEQDITTVDGDTGEDGEAAVGLALTGLISASDAGASIHASLSVSLSERSSTPGRYYGVLQGTDLRTHLAAYIGSWVWEVVSDSANVKTSIRRRVMASREPS